MAPWRLLFLLLRAGALACGLTSLWLLAQSPFAAPYVERGEAELRLTLERAMARQVTADWLLPRVDAALADGDAIALESYLGLARRHRVDLGPDRAAQVAAALDRKRTWVGQTQACAACAWDIRACDSVQRLAACSLPVELSPLGDLNALRRVGTAWAAGAEVDRIEAGLAALGLGASGAVLATGGTSGMAKLGTTALRLSRRMGTLTPALARTLREAVPQMGLMRRGEGLTPLAAIAEDLGRLRHNTSAADTLLLMRHVDSAGDAARLARLSAAAGADTRPALLALGKARAFRLLVRLSDLARTTIAMLTAVAAQLAVLALSLVLRAARRQIALTARQRAARRPETKECASSLSCSTTPANA